MFAFPVNSHTQHVIKKLVVSLPVFFVMSTFLFLASCSKHETKSQRVFHITGQTMGTSYSVKWIDDESDHLDLVRDIVEARLKKIIDAMSTYEPTSEISSFNKKNVEVKYKISNDFYNTLNIAQSVSTHTNGAFDITVSPLINLWGFGHTGNITKQPSKHLIEQKKKNTGFKKLVIFPKKNLIKKTAPITINLSAIAKGYAVDAIATTLERHKISNYFIEIGGEVLSRGFKLHQQPWVVGIEKPISNDRALQEAVDISNIALATSGDYRNYFEENGKRFSHTIDPTTGYPITHKLASVSVLKHTCAEADAYATALMVMGDEKGVQFAQNNNIDALFIIKSDSGFKEIMTGDFAKRILPFPKP